MLDEVAFLGIGADDALAAAALFSVGVDGHTLDVAGVADGNDDLFFFDEVLQIEGFSGLSADFGAALVAVKSAMSLRTILSSSLSLARIAW